MKRFVTPDDQLCGPERGELRDNQRASRSSHKKSPPPPTGPTPPSPPRPRSAVKRGVGQARPSQASCVAPNEAKTVITVEPVGAVVRSPKGTNPRPPAAVKTTSTQIPASSWTLPTQTTLMGLRGPHRKYCVLVNIRTLSELNTRSRYPVARIRSRWVGSGVAGSGLFPWTGAISYIHPDPLLAQGIRVFCSFQLGFRPISRMVLWAGGILLGTG